MIKNPGKLKVSCTLGAVNLPQVGLLNAVNSRFSRKVDTTNTISQTVNFEAEKSGKSNKLIALSAGEGGYIPKVNLNIGAPSATFSVGSILPDRAHPVLSLIKGPQKSQFTNDEYVLPDGLTIAETRTATSSATSAANSSDRVQFFDGLSGYVPLIKTGAYAFETEKTTWNIWKNLSISDTDARTLKIIGNIGFVNESEAGPPVTTSYDEQGAFVTVFANKTTCVVGRIFPLSDDLLYNSPNIYYSSLNSVPVTKVVRAKGGVNCGFRLHFNFTKFNVSNDPNINGQLESEIIIEFGDPTVRYQRNVSNFAISLKLNSSTLKFVNPYTLQIEEAQLKGPTINAFGGEEFDVFVHFAGQNMYVGLDPRVETWDVFTPFRVKPESQPMDDDERWPAFISEKARIYIGVKNLACSFKYEPICFDNFNYNEPGVNNEIVQVLDSSITLNTTAGVNFINYSFNSESSNASSLSENNLNIDFLNRRSYSENRTSIDSKIKKTEINENPTFYTDWRRVNAGPSEDGFKFKTDSEYNTNPEIYIKVYNQYTSSLAQDKITTLGAIKYNTTIEGPIFFYIRNFKTKKPTDFFQKSGLVIPIWGKYGDISSYLTNVQISEDYENKNISYRTSSATLTFSNLTNDPIGIQILNAMQENLLVYTIKAGYGNNVNTFFQGIGYEVEIERSPDDFTIKVKCQDLGDFILDNVHFNNVYPMALNTRTVKGMLEDCFQFAGLYDYYAPRPRQDENFDVLHDVYLNTFFGNPNVPNSSLQKLITVNRQNTIKEIVLIILDNLIYSGSGDKYTSNYSNYIPVLFYDIASENFKLHIRSDAAYGFFPTEEFYFTGNMDNNGDMYLGNQNQNGIHGLVTNNGWSETTNLKELYSEVHLFYKRFDGVFLKLSSDDNFIFSSVGNFALEQLQNLVVENNNFQPKIGYVGFRKDKYINDAEKADGLLQTTALAKRRMTVNEYKARNSIQDIVINIYVTKPLTTYGKFKVKSLEGGINVDFDGEYLYKKVDYFFNIDQNIITAKIEAAIFPGDI